MKNIALGQYYAGDSVVHRFDARTKVILALVYIVCTFVCKNVFSFLALFLSAAVLVIISKIPVKIILKALKPIIIIMLFTVIINVFWTSGEKLLFSWRFINIYLHKFKTSCIHFKNYLHIT